VAALRAVLASTANLVTHDMIGACRSMSLSIEAVIVEPSVVSVARVRAMKASRRVLVGLRDGAAPVEMLTW
jgi:hypothetical protein